MDSNGTLDGNSSESTISLPQPFRFWIFLTIATPSIYCSFLLLFHLFANRNLRSHLGNHIIIGLLIIGLAIELIDAPLHLIFLYTGAVRPSASILCYVFWFLQFELYNSCTIIMAWGSVQRYLLIFHNSLFISAKNRFLLHYLPMIVMSVYIVIFYINTIVFPPCVSSYDYRSVLCDHVPCYWSNYTLELWDSIVNSIIPTVVILIFNVSIVTRVYWRKYRLHQMNLWRKQRQMTIQLLSICVLYLIANVPVNVVIFARLFALPREFGVSVQAYSNVVYYLVTLLFPFVCLGILSKLRKKIQWKGILLFQRAHHTGVITPR